MNLAEEKKKIEKQLVEKLKQAFTGKTEVKVVYGLEKNTVNAVFTEEIERTANQVTMRIYRVEYNINADKLVLEASIRSLMFDNVSVINVVVTPLKLDVNFIQQFAAIFKMATVEYKDEPEEEKDLAKDLKKGNVA